MFSYYFKEFNIMFHGDSVHLNMENFSDILSKKTDFSAKISCE